MNDSPFVLRLVFYALGHAWLCGQSSACALYFGSHSFGGKRYVSVAV